VLLPVVPAFLLLLRNGLPKVVLALVTAQLMVAVLVAITMMGWWFPGRTLVAVLPLLALPLAMLLARLEPWGRTAVLVLGASTLANTVALAVAGHTGEITTAFNPFDMRAPFFRMAAPLFPNYTAWTWHTWLTTSAWLALWAWGAVALVRGRRQGVTLNTEYMPSR
jgi:hypothetical protein